ncbi:MAG: hypothetical protein V4539_17065 [Bacteroidota bacterium]
MKPFIVCVMILVSLFSNAQGIGLRLGHSLTPADHLSIRYEHWTNGAINFAGAAFYERSRANSLNYSCYGIDLLGEYIHDRQNLPDHLFGWRSSLGATIQSEADPWVYKDYSLKRTLNYGLVAEGAVECYLTETFRLSLFAQQKLLLRSALGLTRFAFGLGLTYNFPN